MARAGRRKGDEIQFRCPYPASHQNGDANPSARYNPKKGAWCCDICKNGGGWTDLCGLLGVDWKQRAEIVATYPYKDEAGQLLFEVVRKMPKDFRQRRPDGAGGWIWNLKGVRRVLYRLPEVLAAVQESRVVYLVEGEKDADNLAGLGLVATTNAGGAGKWRREYSETLRGATVVLFGDNDTAGQGHLQKVGRALHGVAAEVRVVVLPDLPDGGDVSDWIAAEKAAGATSQGIAEGLERLAAGAPSWEPDSDATGEAQEAGDDEGASKKPTQAQLLLRLAVERGIQLFHSPADEAFVQVVVGDHQETWPVQSRTFKRWLLQAYYAVTETAPATQPLKDALNTIEARACFEGEEHKVFTRVAELDDRIYVDLCNPSWEVVEITGTGWKVVSNPPVRFRRSPGMLALPRPVRGGSVTELRPLINLPDDESFALFIAFLVAALRPRGPYPVLVLCGEQGSTKSTLGRMARALVDPAEAPLRTLPRSERDLMISATHAWVLAFDNLSGLPQWLSDAFCRLATGGGFAARQLYTDSDEVVFSAMRPLILNGIDDVAARQDLVDRAITQSLPPIPDEKRRREEEIWSEFEALRPRLLGALLDAVSCALRRESSVRLKRSPRMADFAHWIVAAEPALPWHEGTFLAAYEDNRRESVDVALEADLVASAVRGLVAEQGSFEGTCKALKALLDEREGETGRRSKAWPKSPRGLSSSLRRVAPGLRQAGITIEYDREAGTGRRLVRIIQTEAATDRHNRHDRHEPPSGGDLQCDANEPDVTVADADRHGGEARETSIRDGCDGCDGLIPASSESPDGDEGEELRL